jgi:hypothetical protein
MVNGFEVRPAGPPSRRAVLTSGFAFVASGVALSGCEFLEAKPAPASGFLGTEGMYRDPALPFQRIWRQQAVNWDKYRQLYIAPVDTSHMFAMTEWQQGVRRGEIESDVRRLADYTRESLKKAFRTDPKRRLAVIDTPGNAPDTLIFELALIEVVPSKVVLNMLGHVPWGVGLGISAVRSIAGDKSTVAIEARARDAGTGQVVFMMADREAQVIAPGNLRGLTWYGHAYQIVDAWSAQFVRIANRDRSAGEVVDDSRPFTLKPW